MLSEFKDRRRWSAVQTRIKEYRSQLSMTQDDLAKKVGVRRETIVFLEQGKYNPSLKLAHDVARALHARIDDLFIFDDEPEPERPELREILVD
jgi:putative transcriptional regulator